MKRDSFIFYRSFAEALEDLSDKQYAKIFRAIVRFALDGEETSLAGVEKVVFSLVKPQIEANNKKYENGVKGGRPSNFDIEQVFTEMCVKEVVLQEAIKDFLEHLKENGVKATKSRIESLIVKLDLAFGSRTAEKVRELRNAIICGYKRLGIEDE